MTYAKFCRDHGTRIWLEHNNIELLVKIISNMGPSSILAAYPLFTLADGHCSCIGYPLGFPLSGNGLSASKYINQHSVESPSMVDPQWNIWYWGSKWNLHTVCWSAVGCEWGTTSVYFGITYVCFIPSRLPVFAVEPQYLLQYFFYFCQKYHLNYTYKIFKKFHVGLKSEWGL